MKLYYAPLACSMAMRIALYEAGGSGEFIYVDIHSHPKNRLLADGSDYYAINPMGQVPAIQTDTGELIAENPVVLQYIADQYPLSNLAPQGGIGRYRLQQWLNFISTELHKATFIPLFARHAPQSVRDFALQKLPLRFGHLGKHLEGRNFLLDHFTVADAYLTTVLNWSTYAGLELAEWPVLQSYYDTMVKRPSVARALADEMQARKEEQARRAAA
jgi:glutathione S-transferase